MLILPYWEEHHLDILCMISLCRTTHDCKTIRYVRAGVHSHCCLGKSQNLRIPALESKIFRSRKPGSLTVSDAVWAAEHGTTTLSAASWNRMGNPSICFPCENCSIRFDVTTCFICTWFDKQFHHLYEPAYQLTPIRFCFDIHVGIWSLSPAYCIFRYFWYLFHIIRNHAIMYHAKH